jgi:hypothetical protein
MQRTFLSVAVGSAAALLLLGALGGCAAKAPGGSSNSQPKPNPGSLAHPSTTAKPKTPTPTPHWTDAASHQRTVPDLRYRHGR